MVAHHVFTVDEAIEMVQQGLDVENDVDFDESDEGSIAPDPGEAEFVRDDELGSESGDDELGSESGDDELGSESGDNDGEAAPSENSDEGQRGTVTKKSCRPQRKIVSMERKRCLQMMKNRGR